MKKCQQCGGLNNLFICSKRFNKKTQKEVASYLCRSCNTERVRKYRKTKSGKIVYRRIMHIQYHKFKHKCAARQQVYKAIKKGILIKPSVCSKCNLPTKLEGHHTDYAKPLEVIWVCRPCHFLHYQ